jgi:hypothetical protein
MISGKSNSVWGVVGVLIVVVWFLLLSFHPRTVLTPPRRMKGRPSLYREGCVKILGRSGRETENGSKM